MTPRRIRRSLPACAVALGVTLAVGTGCGENGTPTPATSTPAAATTSAPAATSAATPSGAAGAFDPCTALTESFLAGHQWNARTPERKQTSAGGASWQGCAYLAQARYSFVVQTTNSTLAQVGEKFPTATALIVDGRKALRYVARPDVPGGCTINVEMASGSLYLLVDDPRGAHPRKLSPCDNVTEIADAVVPLLPAGS